MAGRAILRHRGAWAPSQIEGPGSIRKDGDGFLVEAEGASAKELNRTLLNRGSEG
jgi:hypothetical protein